MWRSRPKVSRRPTPRSSVWSEALFLAERPTSLARVGGARCETDHSFADKCKEKWKKKKGGKPLEPVAVVLMISPRLSESGVKK